MRVFPRLLKSLWPYRWRLLAAGACSTGVAAFTATYAWLVQPLMDGVLIEQDAWLFRVLPLVILGVALLKGILSYGQGYLMSYVGNGIVADVRQHLFDRVVRLPVPFHDVHASGRLMSRVIHDVNEMANAIPSFMKDLFQQGLTCLALMGVIVYQNWQLAAVMLCVLPVSGLVLVKVSRRLRTFATQGQESMGDMSSVLKEVFTGIQLVKAYGQEQVAGERFRATNQAYRRASQKSAQVAAFSSPLMEMIGVCGLVVIVWYGGHLVSTGVMSPGQFSSFFAALFMSYTPIKRLSGANQAIQRALAAAQRVFEVMDLETEEDRDAGKRTLAPMTQALEFQDVSFWYEGTHEPALRHISFTVRAGECVALVGRSGSGKSTLVSLVPRFYLPSEGAIVIDGQDNREVTSRSLRQQLGVVSQDTVLFDDTIKQNIAFGCPGASDQAIEAAAKRSFAWEFIASLPQQLETRVGENGMTLSGGQRQRLAIARAILRDPPILILDEATSSLDSASEQMVQEALTELMKGRTTLVIAHRFSTVEHADRIIVLDHGRMVESGDHETLLNRGAHYAKLYHTQFRRTMAPSVMSSGNV